MENTNEKRWISKKIYPTGEYKEEVTYEEICKIVNHPYFIQMVQRMDIGDVLFYNEKNIEFQRIK